MTQYVTGVFELDRKLETLKKGARNSIVRPAVNKAVREGAKIVKGKIPSRYKDVRAAIGGRMVKAKQTGGEIVGKIGAGVGKRSKSAKKQMGSLMKSYSRNRPGVGISANNIHWWFMGTKERTQKTTGRRTGKMESQESPVMTILAPHGSRLKSIITEEVKKRLTAMALKGK